MHVSSYLKKVVTLKASVNCMTFSSSFNGTCTCISKFLN